MSEQLPPPMATGADADSAQDFRRNTASQCRRVQVCFNLQSCLASSKIFIEVTNLRTGEAVCLKLMS